MESRTKTPHEMLLINGLAKVANDPIVQGAAAVNVVGVGSNENCRNRVPRLDEVLVQLDAGHRRHMDVSHQAGRFDEARGSTVIVVPSDGRDVKKEPK